MYRYKKADFEKKNEFGTLLYSKSAYLSIINYIYNSIYVSWI